MTRSIRRRLLVAALLASTATSAAGQSALPDAFEVWREEFDGSLENWQITSGSLLAVAPSAAHSGSGGLEVVVSAGESHLAAGGQRELARAQEGYLTFRFNPATVVFDDPGVGFVPGRSIQIAAVKGPGSQNLVAIRFREAGSGYEAFLEWRDGANQAQWDHGTGSVSLASGWQEITIGFRVDDWIACWVDGVNMRSVTGLTHVEPYGSRVEVGKTLPNTLIAPSGELHFDELRFELPRISDLWVDAAGGDDAFDGTSPGTAFATISRASDLAGAGTTVHILPGLYREAIAPAQGGLSGEPAVYRAENGPGTVVVRGSAPSSDLAWTPLASNSVGLPAGVDPASIWWTDLSGWELSVPPLQVVRTGGAGSVVERLPMAREPDWEVGTPHKPSEWWWVAGGGAGPAPCDPATDPDSECDFANRSLRELTDLTDDGDPAGIEPGHLGSLGDLTGATLIARDAHRGHYHYRRTIVAHDVTAGRVTVDSDCPRGINGAGLGWGSRYYVEDHPALLDQPGEWWYDRSDGRLYLWPPGGGDPGLLPLEIPRHATGFNLRGRSHVTLRDLDLELFNGAAVQAFNEPEDVTVGGTVVGCRLGHANTGLLLHQETLPGQHLDKRIEDFTFEGNLIHEMDWNALYVSGIWEGGSQSDDWERPGVFDILIRANDILNVGYRAPANRDSPTALTIRHGESVTVEDNFLSDIAHDGIMILESVVQSPAEWGFAPHEIQTGSILVKDNVVERACQLKNDCGAIRIWGQPPDKHVFRDLLVIGNTLRDTVGWSWAAEKRGVDSAGQIPGAGGSGLYVDTTSGVIAYRNVAYNNGLAGFRLARNWRDGAIYFYNNVLADNPIGIRLAGRKFDTHPNVDTRIRNNLVVNNESYGIVLHDLDGDLSNTHLDRNLYRGNGWADAVWRPGALKLDYGLHQEYRQTLTEIQTLTPFEDDGKDGLPVFVGYDFEDHDPFDGSVPDFRPKSWSVALDAGTATLPPLLDGLLGLFGLWEPPVGPRYDQGAFEADLPCTDETILNLSVDGVDTSEACATLTLSSSVEVTATGTLYSRAGQGIVLGSGFRVAPGGRFVARLFGP